MARTPLYSRSPQRPAPAPNARGQATDPTTSTTAATTAGTSTSANSATTASAGQATAGRATWLRRHERWAWATAALVLALLAAWPGWRPRLAPALTLAQIDRAVRESIAREPLPSATAAAYQAILPSLVRVTGDAGDDDATTATQRPGPRAAPRANPQGRRAGPPHARPDDEAEAGAGARVGTGVVVVDSGLILTNLHVVAGAQRIQVTFADGTESEAIVVNRQPENDLAVLQARTLPDDLQAATLRATQGLSPGDAVVAVGFPFGIGPSASAGVVSGLKREFRSPQGQQLLSNLIQFDAAANPGNSGGPLVTLDGHVVGIVTAIMNPEGHSTFIGIGFAVPIENAAAAVGLTPF